MVEPSSTCSPAASVPRDEAAFERQLRRGHLLIPLPAGEPNAADGEANDQQP
jgi:hypothetical protein